MASKKKPASRRGAKRTTAKKAAKRSTKRVRGAASEPEVVEPATIDPPLLLTDEIRPCLLGANDLVVSMADRDGFPLRWVLVVLFVLVCIVGGLAAAHSWPF